MRRPLPLVLAILTTVVLLAAVYGVRADAHAPPPSSATVVTPASTTVPPSSMTPTPRPPALTATSAEQACLGLVRLVLTVPWGAQVKTETQFARFATPALVAILGSRQAGDITEGRYLTHDSLTATIGRVTFARISSTKATVAVVATQSGVTPRAAATRGARRTTTHREICTVVATRHGARVSTLTTNTAGEPGFPP